MDYVRVVETLVGETTELKCHSGKLPLQYCRFISPTKIAYHLSHGQDTGQIAYSGKGLEYGDCGIKIYSVRDEDLGSWMCIIRIGQDYQFSETSVDILLYQDPSIFSRAHLATTIGVTLGVLFIVGALVGFFLYRRFKIRRRMNDSDQQFVFQRSSNDLINNSAVNDYNTLQSGVQSDNEAVSPSVYRRNIRPRQDRQRNEEIGESSNQPRENDVNLPAYYNASLSPPSSL